MYRLATLPILMLVLLAGCGSGDDDADSAKTPAAQTRDASSAGSGENAAADDGRARAGAERKDKRSDESAEAKDQSGSSKAQPEAVVPPRTPEELAKRIAELPTREVEKIVKAAVLSALPRFGLKFVSLDVGKRGRRITVVVSPRGACNMVASQEPQLVQTIKQGAPVVKSARIKVAGSGKLLGYYVLDCKPLEIPSGPGRVVLNKTGVGGPWVSKKFRITRKRWALEWENNGSSMAVIVVPIDEEAKSRYTKPVASQKRETGRYLYKGPGVYELRVGAAGAWTVRVKEMGN